jgi:hypothetical protein
VSAGRDAPALAIAARPELLVQSSLEPVAPQFRAALEAGLTACQAAGLDAVVYETVRSPALQELYWHRGRPPTLEYPRPVTYARDPFDAWHVYGLAADVISHRDRWFAVLPSMIAGLGPDAIRDVISARARQAALWFRAMADVMRAHGLAWGGDWHRADPPHVQWGRCAPSPTIRSRNAYAAAALGVEARGGDAQAQAAAGRAAVWRLVLAA